MWPGSRATCRSQASSPAVCDPRMRRELGEEVRACAMSRWTQRFLTCVRATVLEALSETGVRPVAFSSPPQANTKVLYEGSSLVLWEERTYCSQMFEFPPRRIHKVLLILYETGYMGHGTACECAIAIPALEDTNKATLCIPLCKRTRIASKAVVEGSRDLALMPGHARVFVFTRIKTAAVARGSASTCLSIQEEHT